MVHYGLEHFPENLLGASTDTWIARPFTMAHTIAMLINCDFSTFDCTTDANTETTYGEVQAHCLKTLPEARLFVYLKEVKRVISQLLETRDLVNAPGICSYLFNRMELPFKPHKFHTYRLFTVLKKHLSLETDEDYLPDEKFTFGPHREAFCYYLMALPTDKLREILIPGLESRSVDYMAFESLINNE
jgi:hypothetical protein